MIFVEKKSKSNEQWIWPIFFFRWNNNYRLWSNLKHRWIIRNRVY